MKKNIILILLGISFVVELALSLLCFFKSAFVIELFGMEYNPVSAFLGHIIGWFCLLVTMLIAYIIYLLKNDKAGYETLLYILGFWWLALGIGVYFVFGKTDNLLLDSSKGLLLVVLNYLYGKEKGLK